MMKLKKKSIRKGDKKDLSQFVKRITQVNYESEITL